LFGIDASLKYFASVFSEKNFKDFFEQPILVVATLQPDLVGTARMPDEDQI